WSVWVPTHVRRANHLLLLGWCCTIIAHHEVDILIQGRRVGVATLIWWWQELLARCSGPHIDLNGSVWIRGWLRVVTKGWCGPAWMSWQRWDPTGANACERRIGDVAIRTGRQAHQSLLLQLIQSLLNPLACRHRPEHSLPCVLHQRRDLRL